MAATTSVASVIASAISPGSTRSLSPHADLQVSASRGQPSARLQRRLPSRIGRGRALERQGDRAGAGVTDRKPPSTYAIAGVQSLQPPRRSRRAARLAPWAGAQALQRSLPDGILVAAPHRSSNLRSGPATCGTPISLSSGASTAAWTRFSCGSAHHTKAAAVDQNQGAWSYQVCQPVPAPELVPGLTPPAMLPRGCGTHFTLSRSAMISASLA